jgi:hypothetical protein
MNPASLLNLLNSLRTIATISKNYHFWGVPWVFILHRFDCTKTSEFLCYVIQDEIPDVKV